MNLFSFSITSFGNQEKLPIFSYSYMYTCSKKEISLVNIWYATLKIYRILTKSHIFIPGTESTIVHNLTSLYFLVSMPVKYFKTHPYFLCTHNIFQIYIEMYWESANHRKYIWENRPSFLTVSGIKAKEELPRMDKNICNMKWHFRL